MVLGKSITNRREKKLIARSLVRITVRAGSAQTVKLGSFDTNRVAKMKRQSKKQRKLCKFCKKRSCKPWRIRESIGDEEIRTVNVPQCQIRFQAGSKSDE